MVEHEKEKKLTERYLFLLRHFVFTEDDLRGKKILDVGCGDGSFVRGLLHGGVTPHAYGIDIDTRDAVADPFAAGHILKTSYLEPFPVSGCDVVIAHAIPDINMVGLGGENYTKKTNTILEHMASSLKPGGEIRLGPIQAVPKGKPEDTPFHATFEQFCLAHGFTLEYRSVGAETIYRYVGKERIPELVDVYVAILQKPPVAPHV